MLDTISQNPLVAFLGLVLGFSFLIFVHELGHFAVAKWVGIKCSQFAIGMGHCFCSYRKGLGFRFGSTEKEYNLKIVEHLGGDPAKDIDEEGTLKLDPEKIDQANAELGIDETEYRLNYLPLGGYVKMLGQEDMDPNARSNDKRSYNNKPIWARMCVISAGVVMNAIFALIFFVIAFRIGVSFPDTYVGSIAPNSPATKAVDTNNPQNVGLKIGDKILRFNGEEVSDYTLLKMYTALSETGQTVKLDILRDGKELTFEIKPEENKEQKLKYIGVTPSYTLQLPKFADESLMPDPLKQAGVKSNMTITHVNDQPIDTYGKLYKAIQSSQGQPINLAFKSEKQDSPVNVNQFPLIAVPQSHEITIGKQKAALSHHAGFVPVVQVAQVIKGKEGNQTPAEKMGLQAGDTFAKVKDTQWPNFTQLVETLQANKGLTIDVTVIREGKPVELQGQVSSKGTLSFLRGHSNHFNQAIQDSPFASLNLTPGSKLLAIQDQPVTAFDDIPRILMPLAIQGQPLTVNVKYEIQGKQAQQATASITLSASQVNQILDTQWAANLPLKTLNKTVKADSISQAISLGYDKTNLFFIQTYQTLHRLIVGEVSADNLSGPIGIANIGTKITQDKGWTYLIYFLGMISINLAVLNFLPIPVVDGGHMVFLIIEKVKGSPVSVQVQAAATYVGLFALLGLFVFATYNDILRLIFGQS